jgi:lipooligosaccharide transport system permease protein
MTAAARVFEHRALQYRRTFRSSIFASFISPVMFLTAMGIGLGGFVDTTTTPGLSGLTYIEFLAPGLLAASAMQVASFEATFPIMGGLTWTRIFHAMYAGPIGPRAIAVGNLAWIAFRLTLVSAVFAVVMVLFGAARSPLVVLAIPAAVLTGMAFAGPIAAFATTQRTMEKFSAVFRFGITPLFLFSGTFFPIQGLPGPIQWIAWLSPLYHGVELTRGLALGTAFDTPLLALAHAAVLVVLGIGGVVLAAAYVERRLVRG